MVMVMIEWRLECGVGLRYVPVTDRTQADCSA